MDIIIAGTSFPCGVRELGETALRLGFKPLYIDHPQNAASMNDSLSPQRFEKGLPKDITNRKGLFLPLLESWVTEGARLTENSRLKFDIKAAKISRSKLTVSTILANAGVSHVPRYPVDTLDEALSTVTKIGYPIVLRSDSGYSGRGIWIANSAAEFQTIWKMRSKEKRGEAYLKMSSILNTNENVNIIEPWLPGEEWSVDCVVCPKGIFLIRVCEKATSVIAGRPVTLGYRITDSVEILREVQEFVRRWCHLIFGSALLSFACFDIRRHPCGDLVPLDFGVRLGGDCIPLLVRHAGQNKNPYAGAFDAALAGNTRWIYPLKSGPSLVHAFAQKSGTFASLIALGHGKIINSKPFGFVIEQVNRRRVYCRVGTVLTHFATRKKFKEACHTSSEWIRVLYADSLSV